MADSRFIPARMNDTQRRELVQKAKADRLAYEAAQFLSRGETVKAAAVAAECAMIVGSEHTAQWVRHYATTKFKLAGGTLDRLLSGTSAGDVAL